MTDGVSENAREQREAENNAKRQRTEPDPEPKTESAPTSNVDSDRVNEIVKDVLRTVAAMDPDGDGITVTGLGDVNRVQLVLKLQRAIDIVKSMPVVGESSEAPSTA